MLLINIVLESRPKQKELYDLVSFLKLAFLANVMEGGIFLRAFFHLCYSFNSPFHLIALCA